MARGQSVWVVYATLAAVLVLHVIPLPFDWRPYRPPLVELTLFYWVLALPHRVGVLSSAIAGSALDLVEGGALGAQSLGLVAGSVMILVNYQRIRQFDLVQQSMTLAMLVALSLIVERWLRNALGLPLAGSNFLLPVLFVPLLWPLWRTVLRALRRSWGVV